MRLFRGFLLPASVCIAILPALPLRAQMKASALDAPKVTAKDPYAGEAMVIERSDWLYVMQADGTGYRQRSVVVKLQTEAAVKEVSVLGVPFAGASEKVEFRYVRVRHPDGSVQETPLTGVMIQPEQVTREAPEYSDLKEAQIPVKSLRVGDTLEWEARVVRSVAEAPGQFWAQESFLTADAVALHQGIELHVPQTTTVTVWTNPSLKTKPVESAANGEKIYRWEYAATSPTTGTEADAAAKAKKTHVLSAEEQVDEDEGVLPSVAWTTFKSWADVGDWYRGLEGQRTAPDDEIRAKVAEVTADSKTPDDKIRAVYAYVSTQIRYVGVSFGVGRYQPHEAVEVLHNQFGDCKDKQTLLAAMLTVLGVPSDAALIGAGVRFNPDVPSPAAFNHLITHLTRDGHAVWLDSTEEVAPYGMLLVTLRDHKALVVPATGEPHVETTEKEPPFPFSNVWTSKGTLDKDGLVKSHIDVQLRGDDELLLRAVLREISPAQQNEFADRLVASFGYAGTVSHPEFSPADDTSTPLSFSFDYERDKAGDWDTLRIIPELEPYGLPEVDEKEPPVAAIALGAPKTMTSHSELTLPAGWKAELPEAVHEKSAYATVDTTYRFKKGVLSVDRRVEILKDKVPQADWHAWKKFYDAVGAGGETYVQLARQGTETGSASTVNDMRVTEIQQALETAYKAKDIKGMESQAKKLRSIDPKARRLLAWEGTIAMGKGKIPEAIADNWKELEIYPDEVDRYETILYLQRRIKDTPGQEDTLRKWAAAYPNDTKPMLQLAYMLRVDENYPAAVTAAKAAVQRAPASSSELESAQLELGRCELKAGMRADGETVLLGLLHSSDQAGTLNDAAFDLADAGMDLGQASIGAHTALDKLTAESSSWTMDEKAATLTSRTSLLLATWDTVGWVFYRQGKYEEAEPYLRAAYLGRPDDEVKQHLASERTALVAQKASTKAADIDRFTSGTDQQLRTIPLGASEGKRGTAEYRLLLAHGKVERAILMDEAAFADMVPLLQTARLPQFFPGDSDVKLVRQGMVNCVAGQCELVLEP